VASNPDKDFPSQISAFLASRRSTREFLPTAVPQEIIDQILTDSLTAPSWSNTRPFKVAIATGEAGQIPDHLKSQLQLVRLEIESVMSFSPGGRCYPRLCAKGYEISYDLSTLGMAYQLAIDQ